MDEIIILFLLSDLKPGMYFKIDLILINLMPPFMFIITEKGIKSMNYIKWNEEKELTFIKNIVKIITNKML